MGRAENTLEKLNILSITLFVLSTLEISILGLIFYMLRNSFLSAMIIEDDLFLEMLKNE